MYTVQIHVHACHELKGAEVTASSGGGDVSGQRDSLDHHAEEVKFSSHASQEREAFKTRAVYTHTHTHTEPMYTGEQLQSPSQELRFKDKGR